MPELPEVEAWVRELDPLVSRSPILQAGPAHIATLKTFDPPLRELDGRRFEGARRRGKWLLFPTQDGELQLRIHLMSAGRIRHQAAGKKGPKMPAFRLRFEDGGELILTEGGPKKRAGVWLRRPSRQRPSWLTSGRRRSGSAWPSYARSSPATTGGCTRSCATSGRSRESAGRTRTKSSIARNSRRSRSRASSARRRSSAWQPRSTRT